MRIDPKIWRKRLMTPKKMKITRKGRLSITILVIVVITIVVVSTFFMIMKPRISADELYAYEINYMLEQSRTQESAIRDELQSNIERADTLIKESDGKIFDSSRTDLETYVNNVREIPESQPVDSDNLLDYVESEQRIAQFNHSLVLRINSLQESYDSWTDKRAELDANEEELQEEINETTENISSLEEQLRNKMAQGNTDASERESLRQQLEAELQRQRELEKQRAAEQQAQKNAEQEESNNESTTEEETTEETPTEEPTLEEEEETTSPKETTEEETTEEETTSATPTTEEPSATETVSPNADEEE